VDRRDPGHRDHGADDGAHVLAADPGYLAIVALLAFPVVFLYGGFATHRSAWRSLTNRTANMDVLISMGSLPPYLIGLVGFVYPMTSFIEMAATIMTFHLLGRYLETRAKGRASQAIKRLLTLGAKTAPVERDGAEVEVPVAELQVGDVMVVRPGQDPDRRRDRRGPQPRRRVDRHGRIGAGREGARRRGDRRDDQQGGPAQGPRHPRRRRHLPRAGDPPRRGGAGLEGADPGVRRPVTGGFVPAVILISLASFVAWLLFAEQLRPMLGVGRGFLPWVNPTLAPLMVALSPAVAVLVIACPCALGLATPTALMVGSGMGAERGVLIRSGEAIQTLKDIKVVVLDKTGTITRASRR
jgi:P-type Cu+ transporter